MMPQDCDKCPLLSEPFYILPGEIPEVCCLKCKKPACPKCYDDKPLGWTYICNGCEKSIESEQGLLGLSEEHFMKKKNQGLSQDHNEFICLFLIVSCLQGYS